MLRRTFLKIGAATAAALLLPFNAAASHAKRAVAKRAKRTCLWTGTHNSDFADARNWFAQEAPQDGDCVIFSSPNRCDASHAAINLDEVIVAGNGDVGLPSKGTIRTLKHIGPSTVTIT